MNRPRDRASAAGLLPRMEARPWRDGKTISYRYHVAGGKPVNLGTDRAEAIRKVLDMLGQARDTMGNLWATYQASQGWRDLAEGTRKDYTQASGPLLRVFGEVSPAHIRPADIARYLRVERADAPARANREFALLSNLCRLAIERGDLDRNPCKEVRANPLRPRTEAPESDELRAFLAWAQARGDRAALVLVEGMRPADAAREAGLSPQAVSNALARLRRALDLARQAVGADSGA